MIIRVIFVGFLLLLCISFFFQNQDQVITLRYFFGLQEASTYMYVPVLTAFAMGLFVTSLLLFPGWIRARMAIRRKTKALQEAELDLDRLRHSIEKATATHRSSDPAEGQERRPDE